MKIMQSTLLTIATLCSITAFSQPQNFQPVNYTPKQFGINYEAEARAIAQNELGIMYFGSANGIFEFDGQTWNRVEIKPGIWVNSILPSEKSDTIFIGADSEFGFLALGDNGFSYRSLSDQLSGLELPFSEIWKIFKIGGNVYFQSYECIFIFNGDEIKIIEPQTSFHNSFCVNNKLYVRQRGLGLFCLNGTKLEPVAGGDIFAETGIFGMVSIDNDNTLIISYEDGAWIMQGNGVIQKAAAIDKTLERYSFRVTGVVSLNYNSLALSSYDNGILLIKDDGSPVLHKNTANGLIDNSVNSIFRDRENNIWITTKKGISLLPNSDCLSVFSTESGIDGSVYAIAKCNGTLYVGTSVGLYRQNANQEKLDNELFLPVNSLDTHVWCMANYKKSLLVGTNDGLYQLSENESMTKLSSTDVRCLSVIDSLNLVLAGSSHGLLIYSENGKGHLSLSENVVKDLNVNHIETYSDKGALSVWLGSNNQGIARLTFTKSGIQPEYFNQDNGLYPGLAQPVRLNGDIYILNQNGHVFSLDSAEIDAGTFIKYFDDATLKIVENINLVNYSDSITWISQGTNLGYMLPGDSIMQDQKFRNLDVGKINTIFTDNGDLVWLGATDGLVLCNNSKAPEIRPFYGIVRSIASRDTSVSVYSKNPKIDYRNNSISFRFSAPWFQTVDNLEFSFILEGLENSEWSSWNMKSNADFSGLREGTYTFKVKARNAFGIKNDLTIYNFQTPATDNGNESTIGEYRFTIRPPWFRTIGAYLLYAVTLALAVFGIVKYYTYQLKERNRLLNKEVKRQTKQIQEQLEQITDSINYAARIQRQSLPNTNIISKYVSQSFILFKPRDIVSGDFYWCTEVDNKLIITAADCTGHGVPGAMMSMLGMNSLNSIVKVEGNTCPGKILDELRDSIIRSFADKGEKAAKDGMDICLLCVDPQNMKLHFAGAHNPLLQMRNGELTEHKVDKFPCALTDYQEKLVPFSTQTIDIEKGDCFYFMSDGFCDQFGGPDGNTKFMKKRLKSCLSDICNLPLPEQGSYLEKIHNEFRGSIEQIDDILVIGIKI